MLTVTHSGITAQLLNELGDDEEIQARADDKTKYIDGVVVKSDINCGPHLTLLTGVDGSRLGDNPKEKYRKIVNEIIEKNNMIPSINIIPISIVGVREMGRCTQEEDGVPPYVCIAFEVEVSDVISNLRKEMDKQFPRFVAFDDWIPHVTVGYFKLEHAANVMDGLKVCIGQSCTAEALEYDIKQ